MMHPSREEAAAPPPKQSQPQPQSQSSLSPKSPQVLRLSQRSSSNSKVPNNQKKMMQMQVQIDPSLQSPLPHSMKRLVRRRHRTKTYLLLGIFAVLGMALYVMHEWGQQLAHDKIETHSFLGVHSSQLVLKKNKKNKKETTDTTNTNMKVDKKKKTKKKMTTFNDDAVAATTTDNMDDDATIIDTTDYASFRTEILNVCGELCDLNSRPIQTPNPNFGLFGQTFTNSAVNCTRLFESSLLDQPATTKIPPKNIPRVFLNDFTTMHGGQEVVKVIPWYIQEVYLGKQQKQTNNVWDRKTIEQWKHYALTNQFEKFGNYQVIDRRTLYETLVNVTKIQGQHVLVLGSETPWVEAICLAAGAKHVTTLEYAKIETSSKHPQITTVTPLEFRNMYLKGKWSSTTSSSLLFDAVISYSSLEHSGLGRYGDALNPWADIMTVARAWCVTKPQGGTLTLGVPGMEDALYFNAFRSYGPLRWPYLTTNWVRVNYTAQWKPQDWQGETKKLKTGKYKLPTPSAIIFRNQSSLVFRKSGPPGSEFELKDLSLLYP